MLSPSTMTDRESANAPDLMSAERADTLLSDEPTLELVIKAREGDRAAVEAILERCLPSLKRWAHGKLPAAARGALDTGDLVQDATYHTLRRLHAFEPRHVGAMQAYLRQSVMNRIRDEVRRIGRHPAPAELVDEHPAHDASPLDAVLEAESYARYRDALAELRPRDRELVVARVEAEWSLQEISTRFGIRTIDAARMAVGRALQRLRSTLASR